MISLSEKEEFLNNIQKLEKKIEGRPGSRFIIHDLGHCFDIKNKFESKHDFMLNLLEMDKFYSSLSLKERNQSEKNALMYEISLYNMLNQDLDFISITNFIFYNYKFETDIDNENQYYQSSKIYNEVCLMAGGLSPNIQKELFLFSKDIISKWAKPPFNHNEMFYNDNYDEEYYNDNQIAEIGGRL